MWGEDLEEQRRRREWLRQVYDKAIKPENTLQTPLPKSTSEQNQSSYPSTQDISSKRVPNSSWKNPENDFIKGIMKSPYIQLIQYLNNRL